MVLKVVDYLLIVLTDYEPLVPVPPVVLLPFHVHEHTRGFRSLLPPTPSRHDPLNQCLIIPKADVVLLS
jgi:hypothetical protein